MAKTVQLSLRVPFGLRNGRMVSPGDVESGLACGCICPGCEAPLLAKKGDKVVWHFAHESAACDNGTETAIHRMAKQILAEDRTVALPGVDVSVSAIDAYGQEKKASMRIAPPTIVQYHDVLLEVAKDSRRPDAVGTGGSATQEHYIEVFVRHAVDDVKAAEFQARDAICFEICLDDIQGSLTTDTLRDAVTASPERIRWISYPGWAEAKRQLTAELAASAEIARQRKFHEDREREHLESIWEDEDRERKKAWQSLQREERLLAKREKERAAQQKIANKKFKEAPEDNKRAFLRSKLQLTEASTPILINAYVYGDRSFGVARDIWQADVFRALIFSGFEAPDGEFSAPFVFDWLLERYNYIAQFENSGKVAIWHYFSFLETQEYVKHLGKQRFKVLRDDAPWLGVEAKAELRGWFWTPEAHSCSFSKLCTANEELQLPLSRVDLTILFRKVQALHDREEPGSIAWAVARKTGRSANDLLNVLQRADAVTNVFM